MKVTVRARLLGGFAVIVLLMVGIGAAGIWGMRTAQGAAQAINDQSLASLRRLDAMQGALLVLLRHVRDHALAADAADRQQEEVQVTRHRQAYRAALADYAPFAVTPESRRLLEQVRSLSSEYEGIIDSILAHSRAGRDAALRQEMQERCRPQADALVTTVQALIDHHAGQADGFAAKSAAEGRRIEALMVSGVLLAALLGLAFGLLVSRRISRNLQQAIEVSRAVAAGDLTVTLSRDSGDEFADLAESLDGMAARLSQLVGQVQVSAHTVASTSQQLSASAQVFSQSVQQVSQAVGDIATGANEQAQQVQAGALEARALDQAASQAAGGASQAALTSAEAAEAARSGRDAIEAAVGKVRGLHATVTAGAGQVQQLGERSERIGAIVDLIKRLAAQTNLLALNAAIEAARAGEHGRGFAVVADEVRKLAAESATSAEEIATMVQGIQAETRLAVASMEQGAGEASDGVELMDRASLELSAIVGAVAATDQEVGAIADGVRQVAGGLSGVSQRLEAIAAVAEQAAAGTEQVSASVQEQSASLQEITASADDLARMSEEMLALANTFTVRNVTPQPRSVMAPRGTPALLGR